MLFTLQYIWTDYEDNSFFQLLFNVTVPLEVYVLVE